MYIYIQTIKLPTWKIFQMCLDLFIYRVTNVENYIPVFMY